MIELQDILNAYFPDFAKQQQLPYEQYKVINALTSCRSEALGSHIDTCDACGHLEVSYNSCRNRNCPKCQSAATSKDLQTTTSTTSHSILSCCFYCS